VRQPKIAKNHLRPIFLGFKVLQESRSSKLVTPVSSSAVLVMICSNSATILVLD